MDKIKPFLVIAGPTATGKTETAVELALLIGGEIISADSMQVYKYMDIGTAKPRKEEMRGIRHYLIDEIFPDEDYSAFIFQKKAKVYAEEIRAKGKIPIICGGTGFYINALINESGFAETEADWVYRDELFGIATERGGGFLHAMLEAVDPEAASGIHENNVKRVVRALEYYKQTGMKISEHNKLEREKTPGNTVIFVLHMARDVLYQRINARVGKMLADGLEDEVRGLLGMGYGESLVSMQGIGYKEMAGFIKGRCSLEEAAEQIKTGTRHYAKRQLTWFSRQSRGKTIWLDVSEYPGKRELAKKIISEAGL